MKNLIFVILAVVALFCASLTLNTNANASVKSNISQFAEPYYVKVVVGDAIYIYEYDGPGGKLVNVWIESLD
jgi:hypothetical protein